MRRKTSSKVSRGLLVGVLFGMAVCFAAGGCVRVKPWERDLLSKRAMTFDSEKDENLLDHTYYEAREGADGGFVSGGGGCGCK